MAARLVPGTLRSGAAYRARWGMIDQGISSITNFVIALVIARQATPRQFGAFGVALTIYLFLLWIARALATEPFVVRLTSASLEQRLVAARAAVGTALTVGSGAGALMVLIGVALWSTLGAVLIAMGLAMPALLTQDAYRYVLVAEGRARAMAFNDAVWFVAQGVAVAFLVTTGYDDAAALTLAFGAGATCAAVVAVRQTKLAPSPRRWREWLREHRDLGVPFMFEHVAVNGVSQIALLGVALVSGVIAVGELRASVLLLSPPTVAFAGMFLVGIPEAVRMRERSLDRLFPLVVGLAALSTLVTVVWAGGVAFLPTGAGTALLGSNWRAARHLLAPIAALTAANASTLAAVVGLRALEAARASLRTRLWASPVILIAGTVGARLGGARGAAMALALAAWFGAFLALEALRRALTHEQTKTGTPSRSVEAEALANAAVALAKGPA